MRDFKLRFLKLWSALWDPVYRKALRHGVGATIEHGKALDRLHFDCILDVGANKGQFAVFARAHYRDCKIISFEPLKRPAQVFESLFENEPRVRLVRAAIATYSGTITMHITDKDDSSSPLEVDELQHQIFGSRVAKTSEVPCGRLIDFVAISELKSPTLLKIDTQGFELEVLRGAEELLSYIDAIYCEVSFIPLYKNQPLASDIITHLKKKNFDLRGVYNIAFDKTVGHVQADMLFLKAEKHAQPLSS